MAKSQKILFKYFLSISTIVILQLCNDKQKYHGGPAEQLGGKVLVAKPGELSSIPRSDTVKGENTLTSYPLTSSPGPLPHHGKGTESSS